MTAGGDEENWLESKYGTLDSSRHSTYRRTAVLRKERDLCVGTGGEQFPVVIYPSQLKGALFVCRRPQRTPRSRSVLALKAYFEE